MKQQTATGLRRIRTEAGGTVVGLFLDLHGEHCVRASTRQAFPSQSTPHKHTDSLPHSLTELNTHTRTRTPTQPPGQVPPESQVTTPMAAVTPRPSSSKPAATPSVLNASSRHRLISTATCPHGCSSSSIASQRTEPCRISTWRRRKSEVFSSCSKQWQCRQLYRPACRPGPQSTLRLRLKWGVHLKHLSSPPSRHLLWPLQWHHTTSPHQFW